MQDKMSIIGSNNNLPPKEFIDYLHNLLEEIIVKRENFDRFKKWLKKYCEEYSVDYNDIETEIIDFVELATEFAKNGNNLIERMLHKAALNLYLTPNQVEILLKEDKSKKIQNNSSFCTNCGKENMKAAKYCSFCGSTLLEIHDDFLIESNIEEQTIISDNNLSLSLYKENIPTDRLNDLMKTVSQNSIYIYPSIISNINIYDIVNEQEIIPSFVFHEDGKHLLAFDTTDFLIKNNLEILKLWIKITNFKSIDKDEKENYKIIKQICKDKNSIETKQYFTDWQSKLTTFNMNSVVIPIVYFNNSNKAKFCLKEIEELAEDTYDLTYCAEAWLIYFDDKIHAIECLKKAEVMAENTFDWVQCARAWILLGDKKSAEECLKEAENLTEGKIEWIWCAKGWIEFSDKERAKKCLKEAEDIVEGIFDWTQCAEAWIELFNDKERAEMCLEKAEDMVDSIFDWTQCAEAWIKVFNDKERAKKCLKEAEDMVDSIFDWTQCAEAWIKVFNDKKRAKMCLKKAEDMAEDTFDWTQCAEAWIELLNDKKRAKMCLLETEG